MMSMTYDIHAIASEFDRLFAHDPQLVDTTEVSWGHGQDTGHIGYEHADEPSVVGWYTEGGNAGHPIMSIANEDIQRAGEVLTALDSAKYLSDIERAFAAAGIRFERLV